MKLRRVLHITVATMLLSALFSSCFLFKSKNKCDSCPGLVKVKKTKKASKGSI